MIKFITLDGKEAREIDPEGTQWPDGTLVLYAVEHGEITGRQGYMLLPHLEGNWVREDKRGGTLGFRLVRKMEKIVAENGYPIVCAYALDSQPEISNYLSRLGYKKQPVTLWIKEVSP